MKILVICDSFKGTLTSKEIGKLLKAELTKKNHQVDYIPISDGGEGFLDAISECVNTKKETVVASDALGRKKECSYLIQEETLYVELAEVVGIKDLKKEELSPFHANTYGLGEVVKYAIQNKSIKHIVFGLGGSASTDGGSGLLEALGAKYYQDDVLLTNIDNAMLPKVTRVDLSEVYKLTNGIDALILTDVNNPLLGENGAAHIFGPQKGANYNDVLELDKNIHHFVSILNKEELANVKGAGAAGGTTFGIMNAFETKIELGIKYLLELVRFKEIVNNYDLIITGEGKFDEQSKMGKVYQGIVDSLVDKSKLKVICALNDTNDDFVYSVVPSICTKEESLENPKENLIKLLNSMF